MCLLGLPFLSFSVHVSVMQFHMHIVHEFPSYSCMKVSECFFVFFFNFIHYEIALFVELSFSQTHHKSIKSAIA